ncbi:MAG TPA: hypothetical protein VFK05_25485 [Polyangiaceae bacterium]|nr:hypothetical protein [Polyangiaceae bacterium]
MREATRALIEDLLETNRRLCLTISVLGEERSVAAREDLSELDKRSERWRAEQQSVLSLLEAVDAESQRFEEQFADVERQNANLAALYAAGHALHTSLDRTAVLGAVQEIVINLIGSEQFAIVAADEGLTPHALFGVRSERLVGLGPRSGLIGRAQVERRPISLLRNTPCDSTGVRVCIPLVLNDKVEGFVLIFEFLPQKEDISSLDYELFALVGGQAASALCAAELFATRGALGAA